MLNTTLCYLERGDKYLMLHRIKKAHDLNHDKWIGIGGKCEEGESPEECLVREAWEETGFLLTEYRYRGLVTFVSDQWPGEYMHLFTCGAWVPARVNTPTPAQTSLGADSQPDMSPDSASQQRVPADSASQQRVPTDSASQPHTLPDSQAEPLPECAEGVLEWIPKQKLLSLPIWEGDKIFLRLLDENAPFFSLKLQYQGEHLIYAALNGKPLPEYTADSGKSLPEYAKSNGKTVENITAASEK